MKKLPGLVEQFAAEKGCPDGSASTARSDARLRQKFATEIGCPDGSAPTARRYSPQPIVNNDRLSNAGDFSLGSSFDMKDRIPKSEILATAESSSQSYVPIFLALIVCMFLSLGMNAVVFNSLIIPFIIYECCLFSKFSSEQQTGKKNELASILMKGLMAFLPNSRIANVLKTYGWLGDILEIIGSDFSLYFVTSMLWHLIVGLPEE